LIDLHQAKTKMVIKYISPAETRHFAIFVCFQSITYIRWLSFGTP